MNKVKIHLSIVKANKTSQQKLSFIKSKSNKNVLSAPGFKVKLMLELRGQRNWLHLFKIKVLVDDITIQHYNK